MTLQLRNKWKYRPDMSPPDWWDWEVFLEDEGTGELADVAYVDYVLHPTFTPPKRTVTSPDDNFAMGAGAWGGFTLKAFIHMRDGSQRAVHHMIELNHEPPEGVSRTTHESTTQLQQLLKEYGYYQGPVDGVYGPTTIEAVKAFQRDQGLDVDGFSGIRTWDALLGKPRASS